MAIISRTNFNTGDVLTADQWNTQFDAAYTEINGNLDSANLADNAVTSDKLLSASVTKEKLGLMEYVVPFIYNNSIAASTENVQQIMIPFNATVMAIVAKSGKGATALAIDVGKAELNSSSIGSSFFAAGSALLSASAITLSATGATLTNTAITANSKVIVSIKNGTTGGGQPLLINMYLSA